MPEILGLVDFVANLENSKVITIEGETGGTVRGYFISEEEMLLTRRNLRSLLRDQAQRGNSGYVTR